MNLSMLFLIAWLSPFVYGVTTLLGELSRRRNYEKFKTPKRDVDRIIFQIPTLGNYQTVNRAFASVRDAKLAVALECWAIIEETDENKTKYEADRVVVVPKEFTCDALYKARALEYARRLRLSLIDKGELSSKYLLLQADDDSTPSQDFLRECMQVDADLIVGTITPRVKGFWNTVLDYERSVACATTCNLWTNIGIPIWAHGEALCLSSRVDRSIEYSFPTNVEDIYLMHKLAATKIISSEDMVYTHKVALTKKYTLYNSRKPVVITPPLTFGDAVKQRRRWEWGHIRVVKAGLLPLGSRLRLIFQWSMGMCVYVIATLGVPLRLLGLISYGADVALVTNSTLVLWFAVRGYSVGIVKGFKHALAAMLTSYLTVTLNFLVHVIGLLQGDPKTFEVIAKA